MCVNTEDIEQVGKMGTNTHTHKIIMNTFPPGLGLVINRSALGIEWNNDVYTHTHTHVCMHAHIDTQTSVSMTTGVERVGETRNWNKECNHFITDQN